MADLGVEEVDLLGSTSEVLVPVDWHAITRCVLLHHIMRIFCSFGIRLTPGNPDLGVIDAQAKIQIKRIAWRPTNTVHSVLIGTSIDGSYS